MDSGQTTATPLKALDLLLGEDGIVFSWYRSAYPEIPDSDVEAVAHYMNIGWKQGQDPRPDFSTRGYLQAYPDVAESGMNPFVHFLRFGRIEGRNGGLDAIAKGEGAGGLNLWRRLYGTGFLMPRAGTLPPLPDRLYGREGIRKIVFLGHEASRTGAPLLLLNLLRHLAKRTDVELYLFLERGGDLLQDYLEVAHVIDNGSGVLYEAEGLSVPSLLKQLAPPCPHAVIMNTLATHRLMREFVEPGGPPMTALIHERLFPIAKEDYDRVVQVARHIILPSESSRKLWIEKNPGFTKAHVLHHGLMDPDFGKGDRSKARASIRESLGVPEEAPLVLACGTRHLGKGVDIFLQVAMQTIENSTDEIHFLWLGNPDPTINPIHQLWFEQDIQEMGLSSRVHFLASQAEPEPYFLASDVFLMTSRDDTFPFVVLEAMASRLPVIAFDRAGGAPEALAEGCGMVVPYLSVKAMSEGVLKLLNDARMAEQMADAAESRVRSKYVFDLYADRIMAIAEGDGPGSDAESARPDRKTETSSSLVV